MRKLSKNLKKKLEKSFFFFNLKLAFLLLKAILEIAKRKLDFESFLNEI